MDYKIYNTDSVPLNFKDFKINQIENDIKYEARTLPTESLIQSKFRDAQKSEKKLTIEICQDLFFIRIMSKNYYQIGKKISNK